MHTNVSPGQREDQDHARMAEALKANGYTVIAPGVITVTISRADFDSLKEDAATLRKLENAGVDNWEWYGEALNHPEDFE